MRSLIWACAFAVLSSATVEAQPLKAGTDANSDWGFTLETPGYEPWIHPLREQPNFVAAGAWQARGCGFNVSVFAILVGDGMSAVQCRERSQGATEKLSVDKTVEALQQGGGDKAYSRFDQVIEGLSRSHLYGYTVQGETCLEIHVSALQCQGFDQVAQPLLASIEFTPPPEVNVETLAVARAMQTNPADWRVHQVIASTYLHEHDPPNPSRARRYYQNVLRLGGAELPFAEHWTALEGIGLSWLEQNAGSQAIEPLEQAVALASSNPDAVMEVGESLYNLTCAHSLAKDRAAACEVASRILNGIADEARQAMLRLMRQDPQLAELRAAQCIGDL